MVFHLKRNIFQMRGVVLAALIDFAYFRQKYVLPRKRSVAMPYGIAVRQRFFSFLVRFFLFCSQQKRKNKQTIKIYMRKLFVHFFLAQTLF